MKTLGIASGTSTFGSCRAAGLRNVTPVLCNPDSVDLPPASVDVAFVDKQVQTVTVRDSVAGVYVEPTPKPKPKKADTTVAAPKKTPPSKPTP